MSLPVAPSPISTDDIMGINALNIGVQTMEWSALWALALPGSLPKAKADAGGPYVLPDDWWGYMYETRYEVTSVGSVYISGGSPVYNTARTIPNFITGGNIQLVSNSYLQLQNPDYVYSVARIFCAFTLAASSFATRAGFLLQFVHLNKFIGSTVAIVKTATNHQSGDGWSQADFNNYTDFFVTEPFFVPEGFSGFLEVPFNAAGFADFKASTNASYAIMNYTYDQQNVAPPYNADRGEGVCIMGGNITLWMYFNQ